MIAAALLPGLREIRAPLVAGYVWCVVLWLMFEPAVTRSAQDGSGAIAGVARLIDATPGIGVFAAASVLAYLLGALSLEASRPLAHAMRTFVTAGLDRHAFWEELVHPSHLQPSRNGRHMLEDHSAVVFAELRGYDSIPADQESAYERLAAAMASTLRILEERYVSELHSADVHVTQALERDLADAVEVELNLTATRLIGEHTELYATVDQLRAESHLRLATWLPLAALGVALATNGLSAPATATALVGTLALGALLIAQGLHREAAAADRVVDAIVIGIVTPPVIEKLRRTVGQWEARSREP